jgi:hypothetical protein
VAAGVVAAGERGHRGLAAGLLAAGASEQLLGVLVLARQHVGDVGDLLPQRLRVDALRGVVRDLLRAPAVGLLDRGLHRRRHRVGVHVHLARHVSRGAADGLDQRRARTQEAFLVRVQDRHQRHLGQVETLTQQVDADENVVLPQPQLTQQLHPPQRVDLGVQIPHPNSLLQQVIRQVLRHLLRQRRHEHPLVPRLAQPDLVDQIVDLPLRPLHDHLGVDQPRRPDDLLDVPIGLRQLVRPRRRGQVDRLLDPLQELLEPQRPVVHRRRQPEAVLDQRPLPRHVALVHAADLRDGHVRLVDHQHEVLGEEVQQRARRRPLPAAVDVPRVVLDPGARPDLAHHLDVVRGPHPQPLRLQQLALFLQLRKAFLELGLDRADRPLHPLRPRDVVRGREDRDLLVLRQHLARHRVHRRQPLDLVTEELHADGVLVEGLEDLQRVPPHPERPPRAGQVVARVLHLHQPPQQLVAVDLLAYLQPLHPSDVLVRRAQAVDARHGRDHDRVAPAHQRLRRVVPEPLDLVVDRGVLLDVRVGLRDVRLGLVVVVVRDEVLDRVVREQLAELVGELGGERLVRLDHQRRPLDLLDHPGDARGLTGTGRAEQDHVRFARIDPFDDLLDRRRLVTGRRVVGDHLERGSLPDEVLQRAHATKVRVPTDKPRETASQTPSARDLKPAPSISR